VSVCSAINGVIAMPTCLLADADVLLLHFAADRGLTKVAWGWGGARFAAQLILLQLTSVCWLRDGLRFIPA